MSVFDFIHLLHGARGGESQTNRMCMQESVSMSVCQFSICQFSFCFFTRLIVQFIRPHLASSVYYIYDKYQAAMLHSKPLGLTPTKFQSYGRTCEVSSGGRKKGVV
jgi:hypothetical protein